MDIRRRFTYDYNINSEVLHNNQIWYTSSDGNIVTPNKTNAFGANITNNVYINGVGYLTFDGNVTKIGDSAFYYCSSLTSITIPDSVTTIEKWALYNCSSLTSVTIGDSVKTISENAFNSSKSLTEFKGKFAADGGRCLIINGVLNAFAIGCGATQYTILDSVTMIGVRAFCHCDSLTSVTIPDSVTTIRDNAFYGCSSLTSVNIPDSVTTIGLEAFCHCDSLTSVNIPDSVTTIKNKAFYRCTRLTSIYCKATTPPALGGTFVFGSNGSGRKIYVPTESVDAYKSATRWNEYASAIVGYNF